LLRFAGNKTKFYLASNGEHEQKVERLIIEREQTVSLRVQKGRNLRAFRLRIDGPAKLKEEEVAEKAALAALFANRDRPLPLASNALFGGQNEKKSAYYSFTAGPGEVRLTLNVIGSGSTVFAEIYNDESELMRFASGSTRFTVSSNQQNNEEGSAQLVIDEQKKLLMRVYCANPQKTLAYRMRITGAVQLAPRNAAGASAQAPDMVKALFAPRDSPIALISREISDRTLGKEDYFTFAAGPGPLRFYLEVEGGGVTLKVELFDSQSKQLRFDDNSSEFSLTSAGKREKKKLEITLEREENLLMRLSASSPESLKKFRLKLDGAVKKQ
jgi:hypothetical protein